MAEPLIGPRGLINKMEELANEQCGVAPALFGSKMGTAANWRDSVGILPPSMLDAMLRAFANSPMKAMFRPTEGDKLRSACRRVREQGKTLAGTKEWKRLQRHRKRTGDRSPLYIPIYSSEVVWFMDEVTSYDRDAAQPTNEDAIDALRYGYSTMASHVPMRGIGSA